MSSKGFITIAENSIIRGEYVDYFRLAYGMALSIKTTQKEISNVSVIIPNDVQIPEKYRQVFDEIIPIPWVDSSGSGAKFYNEPLTYFFSPYDETFKLESDVLLVKDLSQIWECLSYHDFWFMSKVYTYRNEQIFPSKKYRGDFISNKLPNVYNGMMYFKKEELATEFFNMAGFIIKYWEILRKETLDHNRPVNLSTDVVYAMATKFLDIEDKVINDFDFGFVHLKNELMNWDIRYGHKKWYDNIQFFINDDMEIKINHFKQTYPLHYYEKNFLTDALIKKYEKHLGI